MDLEEKLAAFASVNNVADLAKPMVVAEETSFYNRTWLAKLIRGISLEGVFQSGRS